jgi:basic amino acid/polyamine antiporter, APA family
VLRTKSIEQSIRDTEEPDHQLRKDLSAWDLTVFGIGVIIGTGIFVLTGIAAATKAGPAISLSFVVAGIACALAALCYAEFASTVPVAGSAYTFSYAALGELLAWIIGWDLVLEFALGPPRSRPGGRSTSPRWCRCRSRSPGRARSTSSPRRSCSS